LLLKAITHSPDHRENEENVCFCCSKNEAGWKSLFPIIITIKKILHYYRINQNCQKNHQSIEGFQSLFYRFLSPTEILGKSKVAVVSMKKRMRLDDDGLQNSEASSSATATLVMPFQSLF
jgi:hypothetical protein